MTSLASVKFVPVIVTAVPPAVGPEFGSTLVTTGAGGSVVVVVGGNVVVVVVVVVLVVVVLVVVVLVVVVVDVVDVVAHTSGGRHVGLELVVGPPAPTSTAEMPSVCGSACGILHTVSTGPRGTSTAVVVITAP
jgi:hypothetical protein